MLKTLLILISLRPFISSLAFPYVNFIYSSLLVMFLLAWVIKRGIPFTKVGALKYPLAFFIIALLFAVILSHDKMISSKEIYKYLSGILLFLVSASLPEKDKDRVIWRMVFVGLIISIIAIYQYLFGFQHILNYIARQGKVNTFTLDYLTRKRVFFPFVTPNLLAGYLILIIPLVLNYGTPFRLKGVAFNNGNKFWVVIPLFLALLLTKSLAAWISIFCATVIFSWLRDDFRKIRIISLILIIAITITIFVMRVKVEKEHLQPGFSVAMRLKYWHDTLRIIQAHPLFGVGLGNFNLAETRYAHNSYLQIWAEMGILGLSAFLWLILSVFKLQLKNFKESARKKQILCLLSANLAFLLHNFLDFSFFLPEVSLIWWVILGAMVS